MTRPRRLHLAVGGALLVGICLYVFFGRDGGDGRGLAATPVVQVRSTAPPGMEGTEHLVLLDSILSKRLPDPDEIGAANLDLSSLTDVAARTTHAIITADWDALVASLGPLPLQLDHDRAERLREQWRLLPPRHRPAHLESMTHMELLAHRTRTTAPLESIDADRIGIRVYDLRLEAQRQAAAAEFRRRYTGLIRGPSPLTITGDLSFRPIGLPPLRESPYSFVAAVDIPGRTREGAVVLLTIKLFYYEPFGWVPVQVEVIIDRTKEAPGAYSPRI